MLTREDDVDAHALHRRGWSISVIARHLGRDRKTIRAYLSGGRVAGWDCLWVSARIFRFSSRTGLSAMNV